MIICQDVFKPELSYLVGVAVSGPDFCGHKVMPALFTSVLKHYKWINEIVYLDSDYDLSLEAITEKRTGGNFFKHFIIQNFRSDYLFQ